MKTYTVAEIDALNPCKPATNWVAANWTGTLLEIMQLPQVDGRDKVWVFSKLGTDKQRRLFAAWCARQALALVNNVDPRSIAACDATERYAHGEITAEQLARAYAAAYAVADAAYAVADAAYAVADDAVAANAADAAYAVPDDAYVAAYAAAYAANAANVAASVAAANVAASVAAYAAAADADAADAKARRTQIDQIVELLKGDN